MNTDLEWALGRLFPRHYLLIYQCDHDPQGKGTNKDTPN